MKFLILRVLQHSELGMFHAYRRSGREGSRQRAINFDGEVVDRVFPAAADSDRIPLELKYDTDEGPRTLAHFLKRQAKNWRFEGNCPTDELYDFIEPGCLFALQVDSGSEPATGTWVVFPKDSPAAQAVLADGATGGLVSAGMIALELDEAPRVLRLLSEARPDMFAAPGTEINAMPPTNSASISADQRQLPPGPERLAAILGDAGHSFVSAVADIIDNSISADATEIDITFAPPNSGNGRWLVIRDNGRGMTPAELAEAMRIGGEADYEGRSLGKYGYGLKGASWSQARAFTVVTRAKSGEVTHLTWDRDNMADWRVDDSPLEAWEETATDPGERGTSVLWKKMKAPTAAPSAKGVSPHVAEIQDLARHLGLVFHRFLDGEAKGRAKLSIRINGVPVESNGPVSHPLVEPHDVKTLKVTHEHGVADVVVKPFVLPSEDELKEHHAAEGAEASARALDRIGYWGKRNDTQGLFIYRHDRLIRWGGWHEMWATNDEKTKLARVMVDFDPALDEAFQINISKQTVRLPGFLQTEIKPLADAVRKRSQAKYRKPRTPPPAPPAPTPTGAGAGGPPGVGEGAAGLPPFPGALGGSSSPAEGAGPSAPSAPTAITIRNVTSSKFAWKLSEGLLGGRMLQIGSASPGLNDLARAVGSNSEAVAALAAFLEELDEADVQSALVDEATDA